MTPNYLPLQISDIEALLPMMVDFYEHEHLPFDEQRLRVTLQKIIDNDFFGQVWLIESEGKKIGYTVLTFGFSLEFHGRDAFVDELYISPDYRGCGIGKQTLDFLAEACRAHGISALHLEVDRSNTIAQEVYRQKNFKDHDRYLLTKWI